MVYKTLATDFFYENSGITSLSYYITADSGTIYTGRAFNPKGIKINVRKAIDDWLVNDMPDFREYDGVMVLHEDAYKVFGLYNDEGTLLEEYGVFLTNENIGIGDLTYRGIDGKADPRQKIFVGVMSEEPVEIDVDEDIKNPEIVFDQPFIFSWHSGVTTICYTANTDFTLSSVSGGWFSVTQAKADEFTGCLTFTYSENSGDSRDGTMCMVSAEGVTMCFPVVQSEHVVEYYFNLLTPSYQVIGSGSTYYTIEWDTNYEVVKYSYNSGATISTSASSLTLTFQVNYSQQDITRSVVFYNSGGTVLGTAVWKQEHYESVTPYVIVTSGDNVVFDTSGNTWVVTYETNLPQVYYEMTDGTNTVTGYTNSGSVSFNLPPVSGTTSYMLNFYDEPNGTLYATATSMAVNTALSDMYLTIKPLESGNLPMLSDGEDVQLAYSKNGGSSWTTLNLPAYTTVNVPVEANVPLWLKVTDYHISQKGYWMKHVMVGGNAFGPGIGVRYDVYGNILSCLYGDGFRSYSEFTADSVFNLRFYNKIVNAKNLVLVPTVMTENCNYMNMFLGCSYLVTAPSLPATTLVEDCYGGMFSDCSSLIEAPELPATTVPKLAYGGMFENCSSLKKAPVLNVSDAGEKAMYFMFDGCSSLERVDGNLSDVEPGKGAYKGMFGNCSSLVSVPTIGIQRVMDDTCNTMFAGCSSLVTPPSINVTYVGNNGMEGMFERCSSLTTAPALPTTFGNAAYSAMFSGCTSLTTAPELTRSALPSYAYHLMFAGCTSLTYVKCTATNISSYYATDNWMKGVSPTGTFVKSPSMTGWTSGDDGIPPGWTVIDAV